MPAFLAPSFALFAATSFVASTPSQSPAQLDSFIESEMTRLHIPGVALAVLKDGKIIKERGYGYSNLELKTPVTTESVFHIASVSKQIIAAAVLLLADEGKLSLDDPISKHLTDPLEEWKPITVRQLLSHTSGLAREMAGWSYLRAYTDDELMALARKTKMDAAPGVQYSYSNTGYFLLGAIITKTASEPWPMFIGRRLFKPIGMKTARLTSDDDIIPNRVSGYEWEKDKYTNDMPLRSVRTSGAFVASVHDMALWAKDLQDHRVLSRSLVDRMWTKTRLNNGDLFPYGFGWRIDRERSVPAIYHGGSQLGFKCSIYTYPEDGLSVVLLGNSGAVNTYSLSVDIARFYLPKLRLSGVRAIPETDPARAKSLATLISDPASSPADWTTMNKSVLWWHRSELDRMKNGFQRLELLREEPGNGTARRDQFVGKIAYYRVVGREPGYVTFFTDRDGKPLTVETSRN